MGKRVEVCISINETPSLERLYRDRNSLWNVCIFAAVPKVSTLFAAAVVVLYFTHTDATAQWLACSTYYR